MLRISRRRIKMFRCEIKAQVRKAVVRENEFLPGGF